MSEGPNSMMAGPARTLASATEGPEVRTTSVKNEGVSNRAKTSERGARTGLSEGDVGGNFASAVGVRSERSSETAAEYKESAKERKWKEERDGRCESTVDLGGERVDEGGVGRGEGQGSSKSGDGGGVTTNGEGGETHDGGGGAVGARNEEGCESARLETACEGLGWRDVRVAMETTAAADWGVS